MAARTSKKSPAAASPAPQGIMPESTSEARDGAALSTAQQAATKPDDAPAAEQAAAGTELPPGVTVTGQFNRDDPATVAAIGALVKAALAQGALPPGDTIALEGEPLAAFEARSNVLGSHGFVPAGATIIVNRADFEALKAAGAITGEWPEDTSSAG